MLPTSVFQGGKGNVEVFLRSCGGTRTNMKINGWIWREGIVRTLRSTWLSGVGFEQCMRIRYRSQSIFTCFWRKRKLNALWERNVGESLQQRPHVVFNDRSNCRTHLSPDVQLPTRCLCGAHQAAETHHHEGSREGDTNGRAVLV